MARPFVRQHEAGAVTETAERTIAIAVLEIDLGKNSCSVVGLDRAARVIARRHLRRLVDLLLTAKRDRGAARRFFRKRRQDEPLRSPDWIGTDGAGSYPPAIAAARQDGLLARTPVHDVIKHLREGIESDHVRVTRPMPWARGVQSVHPARHTIQGFEALLWLRKSFGFAGAWTVREQNRLLALCCGLSQLIKA